MLTILQQKETSLSNTDTGSVDHIDKKISSEKGILYLDSSHCI